MLFRAEICFCFCHSLVHDALWFDIVNLGASFFYVFCIPLAMMITGCRVLFLFIDFFYFYFLSLILIRNCFFWRVLFRRTNHLVPLYNLCYLCVFFWSRGRIEFQIWVHRRIHQCTIRSRGKTIIWETLEWIIIHMTKASAVCIRLFDFEYWNKIQLRDDLQNCCIQSLIGLSLITFFYIYSCMRFYSLKSHHLYSLDWQKEEERVHKQPLPSYREEMSNKSKSVCHPSSSQEAYITVAVWCVRIGVRGSTMKKGQAG